MSCVLLRGPSGDEPASSSRQRVLAALAASTSCLVVCAPTHPMQRSGRDSDDDFARFVGRGYSADEPAATNAFTRPGPTATRKSCSIFSCRKASCRCRWCSICPGSVSESKPE